MTPEEDDRRPSMLVIGHVAETSTTLVEAGTLVGWARERGVRLRPVAVPGPSGERGAELPAADEVDAIVVLGSPDGAWDDSLPWLADEIALIGDADRLGTPVLGICFGGQLLARALGGRAEADTGGEHGWTAVETDEPRTIAPGPWLQFHSDSFTAPPGAELLARSPACDQAFRAGPHLGVQFHPEITPAEFEIWVASWEGTSFEASLPSLGVTVDRLRSEIARRAGASRAASWTLFDGFAAQAHLGSRMLVRTPRSQGHADRGA